MTTPPTPPSPRTLIDAHWYAANTRDWPAFAALLHEHLRYDVPQTREYIDGRDGYLALFQTWPGNWRARITQLVCDESRGVCVIAFDDGSGPETGITVFETADGLISRVTDYWPAPYEPPPRTTPHMQRAAP